jgi:hypothetical protein
MAKKKETKDPLKEECIHLYSLYGTPTSIYREMREKYGDNSLSISQIKTIRETCRKEIIDKRKDLSAELPILDIKERVAYLQQIVDGALEGEVVYDRNGQPIDAKIDRASALKALAMVQDMADKKSVVNDDDDDIIRSIVKDAFEDLKKEKPHKSNSELLDEIMESLPQAKPYIVEMRQEYVTNVS